MRMARYSAPEVRRWYFRHNWNSNDQDATQAALSAYPMIDPNNPDPIQPAFTQGINPYTGVQGKYAWMKKLTFSCDIELAATAADAEYDATQVTKLRLIVVRWSGDQTKLALNTGLGSNFRYLGLGPLLILQHTNTASECINSPYTYMKDEAVEQVKRQWKVIYDKKMVLNQNRRKTHWRWSMAKPRKMEFAIDGSGTMVDSGNVPQGMPLNFSYCIFFYSDSQNATDVSVNFANCKWEWAYVDNQ